ncbi:metal-sensing transcriptional repressor [Anaeromicropila populeti]|uniref:Copper-sensing transcriptional repressor CsoR n=1 Tax=Anaeromicropila populeti TaxID=37658 RepID=A0A1I6J1T3_9FIRM|nr:metal-sensing transcriptional repressor [Anaeromicropila populeti]SFR72889.1 DNA-binding transcriptional regulator, FrmR family [Anaeromicropila populeti]
MNNEKKQVLQLLKTAKGQIDATIRMLEDERYCMDISNQIIASGALLKKANMLLLKQHMEHCVLEAFEHGNDKEKQIKIEEVISILSKIAD